MPRHQSTRNAAVGFSPQAVGARIEQLRLSLGMTVIDFATKMDVPKMTYYNYINGVYFPRVDILAKIRETYGVSVDYLLFGGGTKRKLDLNKKVA